MKAFFNKWIPKAIGFGLNTVSYVAPRYVAKQSVSLFCTPRVGRLRPKDSTFLEKCDHKRTIKIETGNIQFYIWNETGVKTIMLMHGWESNSARWKPLINALLKDNYKIVAFDAPAHGASENTQFDMLKNIKAIDVGVREYAPDVMIGHSIGGASLGFYLSEYDFPSFEKIVFLGTPKELVQMVSSYDDILGLSKRVGRLFNSEFEKRFDRTVASISAKSMVKDIQIPALIIHDHNDPVIPVDNADVYHEVLGNSRLIKTDKLGHGLQGRVVFHAIVDFLKEPVGVEELVS